MAVKPLHKIFSQSNSISVIDSCNILIDSDNDLMNDPRPALRPTHHGAASQRMNDHRLTIKLRSTVGIVRSFSIPYSNSRTLNPTDLRCDNSPNRWICLSTNLKQWLDHFVINPNITQNLVGAIDGVEDICFCYRSDAKVMLRTVSLATEPGPDVTLPKRPDIFTKGVRQLSTSLTISSDEFERYEVDTCQRTITTTMSIKEVRSIFELGTVLGSAIDAGFSIGGRPVYFSIRNEEGSIGMEFVLASTDGEELGVADRQEPVQRPVHNHPPPKAQLQRRETPTSSRVDSSGRSNDLDDLNHVARLEQRPIPSGHSPTSNRERAPPGSKLFRPLEGLNEDQFDDDELDQMAANEWDQVEQNAIAVSQTRKRVRLSQSQSLVDGEDEQLLPSQAPQDDQPHWKLFFD